MFTTRGSAVRRWPTERLARYVAEHTATHDPGRPSGPVEVARTELARRRAGGTFDWTCRVVNAADPHLPARQLTVTLPTGVTEAQVRAAALARARRRYGPHAEVEDIQVGD